MEQFLKVELSDAIILNCARFSLQLEPTGIMSIRLRIIDSMIDVMDIFLPYLRENNIYSTNSIKISSADGVIVWLEDNTNRYTYVFDGAVLDSADINQEFNNEFDQYPVIIFKVLVN